MNSDGAAVCAPLSAAAKVNGNAPLSTLEAALAIVRNPGAKCAAIFNAAAPQGPYLPSLAAVPNDWTFSVS